MGNKPGACTESKQYAQQSLVVPAKGVTGGNWVPGIIANVTTFTHGELLELGWEGRVRSRIKTMDKVCREGVCSNSIK
jgi:hypothetical protein